MLALSMSKENQKLPKKNEEIEVENSNLKRIKSLLQHENEKLKKWIEGMKKSDDTRNVVILQVENVIQSLEKMKLWVRRASEAYHVASSRSHLTHGTSARNEVIEKGVTGVKAFVLRVWEKVPRSWRIVCYSDSVLLGLLIFHRLQHLMSFTSFVIPPFVDAELG